MAIGYERTDDNRCEMTPDRQVQEAIRGVFAKFEELGSARQVLLWYRQERNLFSYVLFDAEYTTALCDLGYQDARRREDDLVRSFSD